MGNKKATVAVKRPDGTVETIETKHPMLNDWLFGQMQEATRKAGRGELLSYANPEPSRASKVRPLHCERCGTEVRMDAYSQTEWTRFNNLPVQFTAYYCEPCRELLKAVGDGEHTAMDDRREP